MPQVAGMPFEREVDEVRRRPGREHTLPARRGGSWDRMSARPSPSRARRRPRPWVGGGWAA